MKIHNILALERMSLFCHISGLFSVFIGLVVAFMDLLAKDVSRMQTGLYVFITGYALVKIGTRLSQIVLEER